MKKAAGWVVGLILMIQLVAAAEFTKGDRVEAKSYGSWYKATIIEVRANEWKVTYDGYSASSDEWLGLDKLRRIGEKQAASFPKQTGPVVPGKWKRGDRVEALSYSMWYPATIIEVGDAKWKVTYDGYSEGSDEWVTTEKLRLLRTASWKVGDRVEALSYGKWYPAAIIETEDARWKVHYDGYGTSSDEWLKIDFIRAPGAKTEGGSDAAGQPVEKLAFTAKPAGVKAGLEGAFLRVETFYWSGSLSLNNQGWFFTKDGRFSRAPVGGFNFKEFATAAPRKSDGTYWIEGDKIFLQWADGSQTTEYSFARKGGELTLGGIGAIPVKGFKKSWRLDGEYEGGASLGGGAIASSNTVVFRKDGTFSRASVASFRTTSDRSTVSGGSQGEAAGTYEFDGYTLTLTETGAEPRKFTVFAFSDEDIAGRPEYIYRDGTMMKRRQ